MNSAEIEPINGDVLCAKVKQIRDLLLEWLQVDLEGICFLVKGVKSEAEVYAANRNRFYEALIQVDDVQYLEGRTLDVAYLKSELNYKELFRLDAIYVFKEQDDNHAVIQIGSLNGTNKIPLFSPLNNKFTERHRKYSSSSDDEF